MYGRSVFTAVEVRDLIIAWLALSTCFALALTRRWPYWMAAVASLLVLGAHFVLHELGHKFAAQQFGYWAEFRMWPVGIALALTFAFATSGSVIFAAPGAVYITSPYALWGYPERARENGMIAAAGPAVNVALALAFLLLAPFIGGVGYTGFYVGTVLAAFNLLPIPPLDGYQVLRWSSFAWLAFAGAAWALLAFMLIL